MFRKLVKEKSLIIVDTKSILLKRELQIAMLFPNLIRNLIARNRKYNISYVDQQSCLKSINIKPSKLRRHQLVIGRYKKKQEWSQERKW